MEKYLLEALSALVGDTTNKGLCLEPYGLSESFRKEALFCDLVMGAVLQSMVFNLLDNS